MSLEKTDRLSEIAIILISSDAFFFWLCILCNSCKPFIFPFEVFTVFSEFLCSFVKSKLETRFYKEIKVLFIDWFLCFFDRFIWYSVFVALIFPFLLTCCRLHRQENKWSLAKFDLPALTLSPSTMSSMHRHFQIPLEKGNDDNNAMITTILRIMMKMTVALTVM